MKDYDKNKEYSPLKYQDVSNLYIWALSQKLPSNGFKWVKKPSQFNKYFIENYNEDSNEGHFLEDDIQYCQNLYSLHNYLQF